MMQQLKTSTHEGCVSALRNAVNQIGERADDIVGDIKECAGFTITIEINPHEVAHYVVKKNIVVTPDKENKEIG